MGVVYLAEDFTLKRREAIMVILPAWAASPGAGKRSRAG
jgi:hypothetical protein